MLQLVQGADSDVVGLAPKALVDIQQERMDVPAPDLAESGGVGQTFVSRRPNLSAIEVRLAVGAARPAPQSAEVITFHLRASPLDTADLVTIPLDLGGRGDKEALYIPFPPQADSAGRTYALVLTAAPGAAVSVWSQAEDAYSGGDLTVGGERQQGDLYFRTYAQYSPLQAVTEALAGLPASLWLAGPVLLVLLLPGLVLSSLFAPRHWDALERACLWFCLSAAFFPPLFLLTLIPGVRFGPVTAWGLAVLLLLIGASRVIATRGEGVRRWLRQANTPVGWGLLVLFLATLMVRFVQIRDLVVPAWIDSVDHALILRRFLMEGGIPSSYEPLLPVSNYLHHFGFYALASTFQWLTGLSVPQVLLILGQAIGALVVPAAYLLGARLSRRPLAGLVAALVAGLVSHFPAYYVSWGRYTQLTAMILLPAAIVCTILALESRPFRKRYAALAAFTTAAVLLTHYRVFVFYACFLLAYAAYLAYQAWRRGQSVPGLGGRLVLHVAGTTLLAGPWLLRLLDRWFLPFIAQGSLGQRLTATPEYNQVPWDYITVGWNREVAILGVAAALLGLWQRRRVAILVALWLGILFVVTNPDRLGLPNTFVINNGTVLIAIYLPLAVLIGYLADAVFRLVLRHLVPKARPLAVAVLTMLALWLGLKAGWAGIPIVHPFTDLVTQEDVQAMAWIRSHTPPEARLLVNGYVWPEGEVRDYVGSDGGYWIFHLAERQTTVPPLAYSMASDTYRDAVNGLMRAANQDPALASADLRGRLRAAGVTYVYVGERGGEIKPGPLRQADYCRVVYQHGPVWIFELVS